MGKYLYDPTVDKHAREFTNQTIRNLEVQFTPLGLKILAQLILQKVEKQDTVTESQKEVEEW